MTVTELNMKGDLIDAALQGIENELAKKGLTFFADDAYDSLWDLVGNLEIIPEGN